jgi:hypothetical protein
MTVILPLNKATKTTIIKMLSFGELSIIPLLLSMTVLRQPAPKIIVDAVEIASKV